MGPFGFSYVVPPCKLAGFLWVRILPGSLIILAGSNSSGLAGNFQVEPSGRKGSCWDSANVRAAARVDTSWAKLAGEPRSPFCSRRLFVDADRFLQGVPGGRTALEQFGRDRNNWRTPYTRRIFDRLLKPDAVFLDFEAPGVTKEGRLLIELAQQWPKTNAATSKAV